MTSLEAFLTGFYFYDYSDDDDLGLTTFLATTFTSFEVFLTGFFYSYDDYSESDLVATLIAGFLAMGFFTILGFYSEDDSSSESCFATTLAFFTSFLATATFLGGAIISSSDSDSDEDSAGLITLAGLATTLVFLTGTSSSLLSEDDYFLTTFLV